MGKENQLLEAASSGSLVKVEVRLLKVTHKMIHFQGVPGAIDCIDSYTIYAGAHLDSVIKVGP